MNSLEPSQTFEAARRQHLIDATIEALADVGFKAASLSQIARRADVSTGLFAHYFGDKDGLLEATLRFMAARLVRATRQRLRDATSARERLYAVPDSALADQEFERRTSAVWLAFWGQITHSTRYQRIQRIYQRRMLSNLRHDLRDLVPSACVETYATMIASMIDGVWIRSHASAARADGAQARAIVRALIDGLIAGVAAPPMATAKPGAPPIRVGDVAPGHSVLHVVSPVTTEVLGSFVAARVKEIDVAIERARSGLAAWQRLTGPQRTRVLRRCAERLRDDGDELARLDALSAGRPIAKTLQIGLPRAIDAFERFASLGARPTSARVELAPGEFSYTRHEPIGIVAGLGHWSAPLLDACRQAAPALALGNAMIFQPSERAPLSAIRLAALMEGAGVPAGVFTALPGDAETLRRLQEHPAVVVVADAPPRFDARLFAMPKAAMIVFADADMEQAAAAVLRGCTRWMPMPDLSETGVFVQRQAQAAFRAEVLAQAQHLRLGDPRESATQIGPLISDTHLQRILARIGDALAGGATLLTGGSARRAQTGASFLEPTVLEDCRPDMEVMARNLFAPILMLVTFETDDDIVQMIATEAPCAAIGLFDGDLAHARRIANQLRAGLCCINDSSGAPVDAGCACDSIGDAAQAAIFSRCKRIYCRDATGTGA